MQPPSLTGILLSALVFQASITQAASDDKPVDTIPCTAKSPSTHSFYDLRPLAVKLEDPKKKLGNDKTDSWQAKGHDYKGNFTLNICAPVVEKIENVVGIEKPLWKNVSAFYEADGKVFSIGQESTGLMFRGRKLVLQYTGGSPCGPSVKSRSEFTEADELTTLTRKAFSDDDDDEDKDKSKDNDKNKDKDKDEDKDESKDKSKDESKDEDKDNKKDKKLPTQRKSTLISFHCEKDPMKAGAVASFVGTDPDECAYFFEVRSEAACPGVVPIESGLGPGGVFGIIAIIAILVYFIGGVMYNRSVEHSRGWKQIPNYSMWSSIGGFFMDIFIILTSSCARCLPGRRGYSSLGGMSNGNVSRGRNGRPDDENRLIDQLDEEWDD